MDCRLIQPDLAGYYFATLDDVSRERVDAHLLGCTSCLRGYLRLKHHIERGERGSAPEERPSAALRARLRADVAAAFRPSSSERMRKWLRRPVPMYQVFAAAAVAILLATAGPLIARTVKPPPRMIASGERVDTARPAGEALSFY